jgi:hypothetical protein
MSFEGADPIGLGTLSTQLKSLSQMLDTLVHNLGQALRNTQWSGPSASHADSVWRSCSQLLTGASGNVAGLATYVEGKAQQQSQAGSVGGGVGGGGSSSLPSGLHAFEHVSNTIGPIAAPVIGLIPLVGGTFTQLTQADTELRLAQDASEHNYQGVFNESANLAADAGYDLKGPDGFLVGANITLWSNVEQDARAINWSYTVSHLSQLNPLAPGALSSVYHAEVHGLAKPVEDLIGGAISAFT